MFSDNFTLVLGMKGERKAKKDFYYGCAADDDGGST